MLEIGKNIPRQPKNIAKSVPCNIASNDVNILRKINFNQNQFNVSSSPNGWYVDFVGTIPPPPNLNNFHCELDGKTVTIAAGNFILGGIGNYRIENTIPDNPTGYAGEFDLSGDPDWAFAWLQRDGTSSGVDHMASYPLSDTNTIRVPLTKYSLDDNDNYYLVEICHEFDVYLDSPTR